MNRNQEYKEPELREVEILQSLVNHCVNTFLPTNGTGPALAMPSLLSE